MSNLKITLVRSINSVGKNQEATIKALGLRKIGSSVLKQDNPQIRGMVNKVSHLVTVDEA